MKILLTLLIVFGLLIAGVAALIVLKHEVLGRDGISFVVESDRAGHPFEVFQLPDGS